MKESKYRIALEFPYNPRAQVNLPPKQVTINQEQVPLPTPQVNLPRTQVTPATPQVKPKRKLSPMRKPTVPGKISI
jgi:hypothetical protein